ncbi:MAG: hypothetical protein PGN13_10385 [Patulibacter minatonensis]
MPRRRAFDAALAVVVLALGGVVWLLASPAATGGGARGGWRGPVPAGLPMPKVPAGEPMTAARIEVGRRLFYDAGLSANGTQSCASCHIQALAFTDGRRQAIGSTNEISARNTPSLVNVSLARTLTWSGPGLTALDEQLRTPLFGTHPVEMGLTTPGARRRALARIARDRSYVRALRRAFPEVRPAVRWSSVVAAIVAFERSIVSARSRYDRVRAGQATFSAAERRGRALFDGSAGCAACHGGPTFSDHLAGVGVDDSAPAPFHDVGTGGRFRAPSLRNVELTAPYLHDGSVGFLADALAHALPPTAPERDRTDLAAFLRTLTDRAVLTDRRFSRPPRPAGR